MARPLVLTLSFRSSKLMKCLVKSVLVFSVLSSGTMTVDACTCSAPSPRHAFRDATVVFVGRVLETGVNPDEELYKKGYVSKIKFGIEKTWKGFNQSEITLLSDYWLGTCVGFNFEVGKKYLVYAFRKQNILFTYSECAPSLPLAKGSESIKDLNRFWFRLFARANPF
jgi:hypothetical protein